MKIKCHSVVVVFNLSNIKIYSAFKKMKEFNYKFTCLNKQDLLKLLSIANFIVILFCYAS